MQRRVYGVVFLGIGCVAVLVGWCLRHDLDWAFADPHPAIDVDRHVWLGEQELQTTLEPVITIRNRGRQPLVLEDITTSCGCLGVFAQHGPGERNKVEGEETPPLGSATLVRLDRHDKDQGTRLAIPPRGSTALTLRLTVTGHPGVPALRTLQFRTNDPRNPAVEIALQVVPIAHYSASPADVALGIVPVGDRVEREVEIRAFDPKLPPISRAVSSNERVRLTYHPAGPWPGAWPEGTMSALMGRLRVAFEGSPSPGDFSAVLSLYAEGRQEPAVLIRVTGRVARRVELAPEELVLPRASGDRPVYTASCLCRAAGTKTLALQVQQAPPDLGIQVQEVPDNPSLKLVRVDAARLGRRVPAEGRVVRVALLADVDGRRIPLALAVTIRPR